MITQLFNILIFPGILFLIIYGFFAEYIDRKLYARFQNRIGPPWYQPVADFFKLVGKENIVPEQADKTVFKLMPVFALASTITSFFYIPLWREKALYHFGGDVIVVLYLLTIPTLTFFLAGWYSRSVYAMIGAVRGLSQLFAYEAPLFAAILSAALLADTWTLSDITTFYRNHPSLWLVNIPGFVIALISLLGKLEKTPFDIPEAETEIVAGTFTEYTGKLYALFRMTMNIELVVGASLLAAVFMPFGFQLNPVLGVLVYILKSLFIIFIVALSRTVVARLRLDQMVSFCWRFLAPLSFLQVLISVIAKKVFMP
ncbi:MAG TPA: NADH-quinone oxidoreductase subunit H [Candidatus Omnitrophota bacterium]|nr:NADH-quinone oxidoreductase subunit H [Candidatus Omnitrophota bacterium]HPS20865.1 NADH-quinone oxidoreductase subunit H [Candidatus Omnitrophota bacterium]